MGEPGPSFSSRKCSVPLAKLGSARKWHLAQVCGTFTLFTGEAGSLGPRML